MRPKCVEKTCVNQWVRSSVSIGSHCRSDEPGCYKWYQTNPATMADLMFSASSGGQILKTKVQRGYWIPKWGECDTLNRALKRIIDYSYQQGVSSFKVNPYAKTSTVKRVWLKQS